MGLCCDGNCVMLFLKLNTLFMVLGVGLLITGGLMLTNIKGLSSDDVEELLDTVQLNDNLNLGAVIQKLPKFAIGVGAGIFGLALLGYLGTFCKKGFVMIVYAILVLLILIAQIVCIALFVAMTDTIEKEAKSQLTKEFKKYTGPTGTDENSKSWNLFFIGFECCGVDAVTMTNNGFTSTAWNTSGAEKIPFSCCKSATEKNYLTGNDTSCTQTLSARSYHSKGCYQKAYDLLVSYQEPVIAVSAILLVTEVDLAWRRERNTELFNVLQSGKNENL